MIRKLALVASVVLGLCAVAQGQVGGDSLDSSGAVTPGTAGSLSAASFDPSDATSPISIVEGRGVKVGEGTVIHPVVGLSTGVVSNVFYQNFDEKPAGVLRLLAQASIASLSFQRLHPSQDPLARDTDINDQSAQMESEGDLQYMLSARLAYDQMLSGDNTVTDTSGLNVGLLARAIIRPRGTLSFSADNNFERAIHAATFETPDNLNRDLNVLKLALILHPYGRTLSGNLYYHNTLDIFENNADLYPDRMQHLFGIHADWRWLPETKVYGDVSMGISTGIGSDPASQMKATSYPLTAKVGIATLLSIRTSLNAHVGYTNGFYSSGPSYSNVTGNLTLAFRYSELGRIGVGYSLLYQDSVNANFYRDHLVRAFLVQGFAPFVALIQPELHIRQYDGVTVPGPTVRDDVIFATVAGIHYVYRDWLAAVLDYRFATVQTDYRYMDATGETIDPSYTRHELLLGMRMAL